MSVTIQLFDMKFKLTNNKDSNYKWTSIPSKETREDVIAFNLEFIQSTSNEARTDAAGSGQEYLEDMEVYLAKRVVSRLNKMGKYRGLGNTAKIIQHVQSKGELNKECLVFSRPK